MTGDGRELFEGFMEGMFKIQGNGDLLGAPIIYTIPFEIKMWIEKSKGEFKGNYALAAHPTIHQPPPSPVNPGVLAFFPSDRIFIPWSPTDPEVHLINQSIIVPSIEKKGELEVTVIGSRMNIRFKDIPSSFVVQASAMAEQLVPNSKSKVIHVGMAVHTCDFGLFPRDSPSSLSEITLAFSQKILGFQKEFKDRVKMAFPRNGITSFVGKAIIVKTESFYSVVEDGETRYVEQVPEVEKARQLFLEHPELLEKIQAAAGGEVKSYFDRGEKLVSREMAAELIRKAAGGGPSTFADTVASMPAITEEKPIAETRNAKPFEGLVYAIEQLIAQGKEGYNACMLVVDGCWITISSKPKKKELYIQVAGDKYIPKKSALKPEHVKKLEGMKIKKEEGSIDIFSIHHDVVTIDIPQIAREVFQIFDEVLRVSKGAVAYLQYDLVPKPTPEYEAVLVALAKFLPDRREKKKFYWKWGSS